MITENLQLREEKQNLYTNLRAQEAIIGNLSIKRKKLHNSSRGSNNTIYSGWLTGAGVHIQGRAF